MHFWGFDYQRESTLSNILQDFERFSETKKKENKGTLCIFRACEPSGWTPSCITLGTISQKSENYTFLLI